MFTTLTIWGSGKGNLTQNPQLPGVICKCYPFFPSFSQTLNHSPEPKSVILKIGTRNVMQSGISWPCTLCKILITVNNTETKLCVWEAIYDWKSSFFLSLLTKLKCLPMLHILRWHCLVKCSFQCSVIFYCLVNTTL